VAASFDTSQVSPPDAIVTLRSLRRRFGEAFDRVKDPDQLAGAATGRSLSPLGHASWTASALEAIGVALRRVVLENGPNVDLPPVDPSGPVPAADRHAVLARLGEQAASVADAIADVQGDDWTRTGESPAGAVSALDIIRLGVRIGVEHLRAAEAAIAAIGTTTAD
jgi:hypothetical protein